MTEIFGDKELFDERDALRKELAEARARIVEVRLAEAFQRGAADEAMKRAVLADNALRDSIEERKDIYAKADRCEAVEIENEKLRAAYGELTSKYNEQLASLETFRSRCAFLKNECDNLKKKEYEQATRADLNCDRADAAYIASTVTADQNRRLNEEVERLRNELAERWIEISQLTLRADTAESCTAGMAGENRKINEELDELKMRAEAMQKCLDKEYLRRMELKDQTEDLEATNNLLRERLRRTAQILIEEVGADCPCDAEDAARRAVSELQSIKARLDALEDILGNHSDYTRDGLVRALHDVVFGLAAEGSK